MLSPETVADLAVAGVSAASVIALWAVRLEGRLKTHEATDLIVHEHVKEQLAKIDLKLDKLIETRLGPS